MRWSYLSSQQLPTLRRISDRAEWIAHEADPGATFFHRWDWLCWIAPLLDCQFVPLVVDHRGTTVGIAPMLLRGHWWGSSVNRVAIPFLGPIVPSGLLTETLISLRRWALRHGVVRLKLGVHADATPAGHLARAGFRERSFRTYVINLERNNLQQVLESFSSATRNAIQRSERRGVSVQESSVEDYRCVLPKVIEAANGQPVGYVHKVADKLACSRTPFPFRSATATVAGRPVGMATTVGDTEALGWLAGVFPEDRWTQAHTALVWDNIQWAYRQGARSLDMLGAPHPGIESYKQNFRPQVLEHSVGSWEVPGASAAAGMRSTVQQTGGTARSRLREAVGRCVAH